MFRFLKTLTVVTVLAMPAMTNAGVISFIDDYDGFVAAAGAVQTIGFEILPDGSPAIAGTEITPEFNYTDWGVNFSSPVPSLRFEGNAISGYGIAADSYPADQRNWIIADFVAPATAVGVFYPTSYYTVSILDAQQSLLATESHFGVGDPYLFLGFVSDVPIGSIIVDSGWTRTFLESFHFTPIPEPATLALLAIGATAVIGRRNQRH